MFSKSKINEFRLNFDDCNETKKQPTFSNSFISSKLKLRSKPSIMVEE